MRIVVASAWSQAPASVRQWPLRDLIEAHATLDCIDDITPRPPTPAAR